jgi:hypothetical protein
LTSTFEALPPYYVCAAAQRAWPKLRKALTMTKQDKIRDACARTRMSRRRLAATVAVMATTAGGLTALAGPAAAAAGPTARLGQGTLTVSGTAARDVIDIEISHARVSVDFGFDGRVDAQFSMSGVQRLSVQLGGGNDGLSVIGTGVGDVPITISGGAGGDALGVLGTEDPLLQGDAPVTVFGSSGNDDISVVSVVGRVTVDAGIGDDVFRNGGNLGAETISLGDGNDKFVSTFDVDTSPFLRRDDVVDAAAGQDTLELRGQFPSETVNLSARAGHLLVAHDQGNVDAVGFENVTWFGFGGLDEGGGGDDVIVNDLSGTGVVNFTPNFSSPFDAAAPNNSSDQLRVVGTAGADHITVGGSGANITVTGLVPTITPVLMDAKDTLRIDTLAGNDTVDSSGLQRGLVQLQVF